MNKLERLALWYLKRRGFTVLPRLFIGMVIGGNALAYRARGTDEYRVFLAHPKAPVWVLTGSQLTEVDKL